MEKSLTTFYTRVMIPFVLAQSAPQTRSRTVVLVALFYSAIIVAMAVAQLFTYEDFTTAIYTSNVPLPLPLVAMLPALIIVAEVFSLPFFLRMSLSPAFRWVSMILGWLTALLWLLLSVLALTGQWLPVPASIGFFGTVFAIPAGWGAVALVSCMIIAEAWLSWGLWPGKVSQGIIRHTTENE